MLASAKSFSPVPLRCAAAAFLLLLACAAAAICLSLTVELSDRESSWTSRDFAGGMFAVRVCYLMLVVYSDIDTVSRSIASSLEGAKTVAKLEGRWWVEGRCQVSHTSSARARAKSGDASLQVPNFRASGVGR